MEYICDGCVLHDDTMVSFDMAPSIARHMDLPFASAARFNLTVKDTAGEVSNTVGAVMVPDSGALLKGSQTIQIDMYHSSFIDSSVVPWVGSQYTFIPGKSLVCDLTSTPPHPTIRGRGTCMYSVSIAAVDVSQAH